MARAQSNLPPTAKVTVERLDGTATYSSPGRPVAVVSNVQIEYTPAPPPKPAPPPPRKR
jgi:hypothetical protein